MRLSSFIGLGAGLMLSACATTTASSNAGADPEITAVIARMVQMSADEMMDRDPQFVADCQSSVAMSQIALRDQQSEEENAVMNLQLLVWTELGERQEAKGQTAQSFLVDAFAGDEDPAEVAQMVADKTLQCTKDFTEGMKAATAKLKASQAG